MSSSAPVLAPAFTPVSAPARHGSRDVYDWTFWCLLLLFELFVFTLPLFPNGDGPVHIYLSSILWKIATHSSPFFEHFYAIRHLIQPYSFHYYLLILLEHGVSADMAEKIFVGLIWATLAVGFRTLARTLAQTPAPASSEPGFGLLEPGAALTETSAASLLVFPLLFSWPLAAGLFNFTFAIGLLLFALSFYTRLAAPHRRGRQMAAFVGTLVLLVLAHPIPIMVLICLVGLDLGFQLVGGWQKRGRLRVPGWQAAALGLCCLAFVFPILIADKAAVASSMHQLHPHFHLLLPMFSGQHVAYFLINSPLGWVYQILLVCLLPVSVLLFWKAGLFRRLRSGPQGAADRLLLGVFIFLAATLFFPDDMNGSAYFAVRMWYVVWLLITVCGAAVIQGRQLQRAAAVFATVMALLCLLFGIAYVRPVARQQAELERAPLPTHARGLFFQPMNAITGAPTHTWWPLSFWGGVRAFTAHDDVLLNTPWLQLTIVPVRENGRSGLMRDVTPNLYSENASYGIDSMRKYPIQKAKVLALADFVLVADPNSVTPDPLGFAAAVLNPFQNQWNCTRQDFYAVCKKKPQ